MLKKETKRRKDWKNAQFRNNKLSPIKNLSLIYKEWWRTKKVKKRKWTPSQGQNQQIKSAGQNKSNKLTNFSSLFSTKFEIKNTNISKKCIYFSYLGNK